MTDLAPKTVLALARELSETLHDALAGAVEAEGGRSVMTVEGTLVIAAERLRERLEDREATTIDELEREILAQANELHDVKNELATATARLHVLNARSPMRAFRFEWDGRHVADAIEFEDKTFVVSWHAKRGALSIYPDAEMALQTHAVAVEGRGQFVEVGLA